MSFIAGFMEQYNRIEDRNERARMLDQELRAKRENELISLVAKRRQRTQAATNEGAALNALASRVGNVEGSQEYLQAVAKAGVASDIMGSISSFETDDPNKELRLEGRNIMDNFTVFYQEGTPAARVPTLKDIEGASYDELRQMKVDLLSATESPSQAVVDVNTQGVFSGSNKLRNEAQTTFDQLLVEEFAPMLEGDPTPENVELIKAINDLESDSVVARSRARNRLMRSPQGVSIYNQMMEMSATIPSFGVLKDMPGAFNELGNANYIVNNWDALTEDRKALALKRFPYIQSLVR